METSNIPKSHRMVTVFAVVLIAFGGLLCFFALVHRIDGPDDFHGALAWDLFVGIPVSIGIWLKSAQRCRALRRGMIAFGVWAAIATVFIIWHCQQIAARGGTNILRQWLQDFWR